jgi:flagella basal body P-ring formation protein FlgA
MVPVIPPDVPAIEQSLIVYATESCDAEAVRVTWLGIDPNKAMGRHHWEGDPCRANPALRLVTETARLSIRPRLEITVELLVAQDDVDAGEPVTWTVGHASLGAVIGTPVAAGDWVARIHLDKGDPLTAAVVTEPLDARAGTEVTLWVSRGVLRVSASGKLLTDGRVGQTVRVSNLATGKPVSGTLVDSANVEIR